MSFKAVAARIARREKVPMKNARAMLAKRTREALPAAKRRNPKLRRVKC
jgi:hypothetical protein